MAIVLWTSIVTVPNNATRARHAARFRIESRKTVSKECVQRDLEMLLPVFHVDNRVCALFYVEMPMCFWIATAEPSYPLELTVTGKIASLARGVGFFV